MTDEDRFLDVLYALALEDDFLDAILPHFARAMGVPSANAASVDRGTGEIEQHIVGIDPDLLRTAGAHYLPLNPWVRAAHRLWSADPAGWLQPRISHGADLVPRQVYVESEYYRDFNRFTGVGDDMISLHAPVGGRLVGFGASIGGRVFDGADRARAERLLPHVTRALRLHFAFAARRWLARVPGGTPLPALTVREGRLAAANAAALALLERGGPVRTVAGRVAFRDAEAGRILHAVARGACRTAACVVSGPGGRWLLQFVRCDAPGALVRIGDGGPAVSVILTPLDAAAAGRAGGLDSLAGLTAAEKRVLRHLVEGLDVPAIARRLGRGRETVRTHLRNLRRKLQAGSQADLARIGALLMPVGGP